MTTDQPAPAENTRQASTKHHVVDDRFVALLEEDCGIEWRADMAEHPKITPGKPRR